MNWINIFGLILVLLILIPNVIYACKNKKAQNHCTHRLMNILEQTGRYSSMFFYGVPYRTPQIWVSFRRRLFHLAGFYPGSSYIILDFLGFLF